jgi:hypothetical protein
MKRAKSEYIMCSMVLHDHASLDSLSNWHVYVYISVSPAESSFQIRCLHSLKPRHNKPTLHAVLNLQNDLK